MGMTVNIYIQITLISASDTGLLKQYFRVYA